MNASSERLLRAVVDDCDAAVDTDTPLHPVLIAEMLRAVLDLEAGQKASSSVESRRAQARERMRRTRANKVRTDANSSCEQMRTECEQDANSGEQVQAMGGRGALVSSSDLQVNSRSSGSRDQEIQDFHGAGADANTDANGSHANTSEHSEHVRNEPASGTRLKVQKRSERRDVKDMKPLSTEAHRAEARRQAEELVRRHSAGEL